MSTILSPTPIFGPTTQPSRKPKRTAQSPSISKTRKFFRSIGIEFLYIYFQERRGHALSEKRKVVLCEKRSTAFYGSMLHVIPIMASLTLITLNFRGHYIGGELSGPIGQDNLRLLGLQVAAKIIELTIVASLTCIMFALIRGQLLNASIPLGTIVAGFEFSKVSFLWSKEFIATCRGRFQSRRMKVLIVSTIVTFTLLSVGVGPAAAVSSQPTLRNWPAGGSFFHLNSSTDHLFPLVLDTPLQQSILCTNNQTSSCMSANHQLLANELLAHWPVGHAEFQRMPENTLISGRHSLRDMAIRFRGPFVYHPPLSVATTPMSAIGDAVGQIATYWTMANHHKCHVQQGGFCFYNDIFFSVDALQPVVYISCQPVASDSTMEFRNLDPFAKNPGNINLEYSLQLNHSNFLNKNLASLDWVTLPSNKDFNTSIAAVITLPRPDTSSSQILTCSVDARWANSTVTGSFQKGPRVVSGFPKEWFTTGREQKSTKGVLAWPQIQITPKWAESLNSILDEKNTTTFSVLANSVGRLNNITDIPLVSNAVEAVLAVMLSEGISSMGSQSLAIQGNLKQLYWQDAFLPSQVYGNGGYAFDFFPNASVPSAKFQMKVTVNGYGYGYTTATLLSCLLLMIYCIIAISFVAHTIRTGQTSDAWDSIAEMLVLAVNSNSTAVLKNTGAGVHCLTTLQENVRIGSSGEEIEMVFGTMKEEELESDGYQRVGTGLYG